MTNIPRPMNPYAETDFDNAVDNALAEMQREEAIKTQARETRKSIEDATNHYVLSDKTAHESCITLNRKAKEEWMSVMRILTDNGYDFEVHNYPTLGEIEIIWGDK